MTPGKGSPCHRRKGEREKEGRKRATGRGARKAAGWEWADMAGYLGVGERKAALARGGGGDGGGHHQRISACNRLAGGRKCLTDEMARGAMIWDQSCPAKGSQVAAQLP